VWIDGLHGLNRIDDGRRSRRLATVRKLVFKVLYLLLQLTNQNAAHSSHRERASVLRALGRRARKLDHILPSRVRCVSGLGPSQERSCLLECLLRVLLLFQRRTLCALGHSAARLRRQLHRLARLEQLIRHRIAGIAGSRFVCGVVREIKGCGRCSELWSRPPILPSRCRGPPGSLDRQRRSSARRSPSTRRSDTASSGCSPSKVISPRLEALPSIDTAHRT
jgi:hypothetical protein